MISELSLYELEKRMVGDTYREVFGSELVAAANVFEDKAHG